MDQLPLDLQREVLLRLPYKQVRALCQSPDYQRVCQGMLQHRAREKYGVSREEFETLHPEMSEVERFEFFRGGDQWKRGKTSEPNLLGRAVRRRHSGMIAYYLWDKPLPIYAFRAMVGEKDWNSMCFVSQYARVKGTITVRLAARAVMEGVPLECLERLYVVPWEEVVALVDDVERVLEYLSNRRT